MNEPKLIASEAADYVETLIAEMLEGDYPDNQVLLGTVLDGGTEIQIQLHVTRNAVQFMDE